MSRPLDADSAGAEGGLIWCGELYFTAWSLKLGGEVWAVANTTRIYIPFVHDRLRLRSLVYQPQFCTFSSGLKLPSYMSKKNRVCMLRFNL